MNIKGNDKKSFAVTSRQTAGICKHPDRVYVIEYEEENPGNP